MIKNIRITNIMTFFNILWSKNEKLYLCMHTRLKLFDNASYDYKAHLISHDIHVDIVSECIKIPLCVTY